MSPRRNPPSRVHATDNARANILSWLEQNERGVTWLAGKMAEIGYSVSSSSLWKSLHGDRRIVVAEAIAISEVLDVSIGDLLA